METGKDKSSKRKIEVVEHNINWTNYFEIEAAKIKEIMDDLIITINHIGSTSIPNIKAKPIIDILVEVKDINKVDEYNDNMAELGYQAMGEYGIKNRRFFTKGGNNRTHHVHIFQSGDKEINKHLNFRDYMIAHPDEAREYSELKVKLTQEFTYDIEGYIKGKNDFIKEIDRKAEIWRK